MRKVNMTMYCGLQVSQPDKKLWQKRKSHGTKAKATAKKQKPRHKGKSNGTKIKATAHMQKSRNAKATITAGGLVTNI